MFFLLKGAIVLYVSRIIEMIVHKFMNLIKL